MSEQTETLRELELVRFRRRGQNRVHFALVMPETIEDATFLGAACTVMRGPVAGWCGRTLRGDLFVIPPEHLDGWKRNGHVCPQCQMVVALALHPSRRPA